MISTDDMHSENICFSWSKSSNYQEKLRCHACDERTDGKWKIVQCSVRPETAKTKKLTAATTHIAHYVFQPTVDIANKLKQNNTNKT